jgi:hypothetical protein
MGILGAGVGGWDLQPLRIMRMTRLTNANLGNISFFIVKVLSTFWH